MKAVVLVGGMGTRLRPLTYDYAKPMVPICGKPFMEYQLELMSGFSIDEVIFSLGYKWENFEEYFSDGSRWGMKIHYVVEDSPLGTAGAIKNVENYLDDQPFFVFNGDILSNFDLKTIYRIHTENRAVCTIALTPVDNPTMYGVVETDEKGRVTCFTEKPPADQVRSDKINAGLYVLDREVLSMVEPQRKCSIEREVFPVLLTQGKPVFSYSYTGYWMDIGTPEKFLKANYDILLGKIGPVNSQYPVHNRIDSIITGRNMEIRHPLWIGENVKIGDNVKILGPSVIEKNCQIGDNTIINQAVILENTFLGHNCVADQSIISRNCRIGNAVNIGKYAVIGSNNNICNQTVIAPEEKVSSK